MSLEEIKEKVKKIFRSATRDLNKEIDRVWDELQELKPGTKIYKETLADYNMLLDRKTKMDEVKTKVKTCILGGIVGVGGYSIYRILIEHTDDPFFRDIADKIFKSGINGK